MNLKAMLLSGLCGVMVAGASAQFVNPSFEAGADGSTTIPGWVNVPKPGGNSAQNFTANPAGVPAVPTNGSKMAGWLSGYDLSRDRAYMYQQISQIPGGGITFYADVFAYSWFGGVDPRGGQLFDAGVEFRYDPMGGTDPATATGIGIDVYTVWNSQTNASFAAGGNGWVPVTIPAVAGASSTGTLFIINRHQTGFLNGTFVDNLRYEAVPEPGTIAAVVTGLAGMVAIRRRRA